ncbi:MAG: hypothetical protein ABIW79_00585, partial [Gemmatimonas sp.]
MASRKKSNAAPPKDSTKPRTADPSADQAAASSPDSVAKQRLETQRVGAETAASAFPFNPLKAGEHGLKGGHSPKAGQAVEPHDPIDTASTVTEN